jgi:hypothetical protein
VIIQPLYRVLAALGRCKATGAAAAAAPQALELAVLEQALRAAVDALVRHFTAALARFA